MTEARVQNEIRLALGRNVTLFRNNVGTAWTGEVTRLRDGSIHIKNPRPLHAGLHKGSADLIGWRTVTITQEMVGRSIAAFVSIEVKGPRGRATPQQIHWRDSVIAAGGLACIAKNVKDAQLGVAL